MNNCFLLLRTISYNAVVNATVTYLLKFCLMSYFRNLYHFFCSEDSQMYCNKVGKIFASLPGKIGENFENFISGDL